MADLIAPDGSKYRTDSQMEITRLRARGYALGEERPPTVVDEQFHPDEHKVEEVLAYIEEHPEDAVRVVAEEKAGKARSSIVSD